MEFAAGRSGPQGRGSVLLSWSDRLVTGIYSDSNCTREPEDEGRGSGPDQDPKIRAELKEKYGKIIDDGLDNLKKCLDVDKENEDAMSYINLLLRKKADLEDTTEQSKADIAQAEDWSNKSLDMKKIKASRPQKSTQPS